MTAGELRRMLEKVNDETRIEFVYWEPEEGEEQTGITLVFDNVWDEYDDEGKYVVLSFSMEDEPGPPSDPEGSTSLRLLS
jgi:hypothetical protein